MISQQLGNLPSNSKQVAKGEQYCKFDGFSKNNQWLQNNHEVKEMLDGNNNHIWNSKLS